MGAVTAAAPNMQLAAIAHYDCGSVGEKMNGARRLWMGKQVVSGKRTLESFRPMDRPTPVDLEEARAMKPFENDGYGRKNGR